MHTTGEHGRKSESIPLDASVNFSLGFFFLHFQGLKIFPILESLPLRLAGGVPPPELPSSPPFVLCCRSTSLSACTGKRSLTHGNRDYRYSSGTLVNKVVNVTQSKAALMKNDPYITGYQKNTSVNINVSFILRILQLSTITTVHQ